MKNIITGSLTEKVLRVSGFLWVMVLFTGCLWNTDTFDEKEKNTGTADGDTDGDTDTDMDGDTDTDTDTDADADGDSDADTEADTEPPLGDCCYNDIVSCTSLGEDDCDARGGRVPRRRLYSGSLPHSLLSAGWELHDGAVDRRMRR